MATLAADRSAPAMVYNQVTPSDATDLAGGVCRSLWVGTAGSADLVRPDGTTVNGFPLKEGPNPIFVRRVKATNLTAGNIWALY